MSTRKHRKPRHSDLARVLFAAAALCILAALILTAVAYPVALIIGIVAFLWLRYEARKLTRRMRRSIRRVF